MSRSVALAVLILAAAVPLSAQNLPRSGTPLGPHTLRPQHVRCAELPVTTAPKPTLTIKGGHNVDAHYSFAEGDIVVLSAGTNQSIAPGQRYVVRRLDMPGGVMPRGIVFGAVMTAGWLTVTAVGDTTSLATIDFSCDAMVPGDYLEPYVEPAIPVAFGPMSAPDFADRAGILFGNDRRANFGTGDLMLIDRGSAQGVTAGARFAIYRDFHNGLPLIYIGDAVVTEPAENTSQVVVVNAKDAISSGDIAVPRKTQ